MTEKNNGAFVNLIRKAVGLPTGDSSCCGAPATDTPSSCCSTPTAKESETAKDTASGGCCDSVPAKENTAPAKENTAGGCCN